MFNSTALCTLLHVPELTSDDQHHLVNSSTLKKYVQKNSEQFKRPWIHSLKLGLGDTCLLVSEIILPSLSAPHASKSTKTSCKKKTQTIQPGCIYSILFPAPCGGPLISWMRVTVEATSNLQPQTFAMKTPPAQPPPLVRPVPETLLPTAILQIANPTDTPGVRTMPKPLFQ